MTTGSWCGKTAAAWPSGWGSRRSSLLTAYQIHSPDVLVVARRFRGERPKADAMVTDRPGVALGVSSADCGPVLFADAEARRDRRGSCRLERRAHRRARKHGRRDGKARRRRERIVAVLGPSIGPTNYEVGAEFVERFIEADTENESYFTPSPTAATRCST